MTEKIMTLHPEGKQGTNIDKAKYDQVRAAILMVLSEREEMTFNDLNEAVGQLLGDSFEGSIGWYFTTVKLDLEARGLIERVGDSPQRIRIPQGPA
jgi:hypothetical protein